MIGAADARTVERQRHVEFDIAIQHAEHAEIARQHAHHRDGLAIDAQGLADQARVAAEAAFPEAVGQQYDAVASGIVLLRKECPAENRRCAQQREKFRRDPEPLQPFRIGAIAGQIAIHKLPIRKVGERAGLLLPIENIGGGRVGGGDALLQIDVVQDHQAVGIGVGKRMKQHGAGHAEHGAGRADRERQYSEHGEGEAGAPGEKAQSETDILEKSSHSPITLHPLLSWI